MYYSEYLCKTPSRAKILIKEKTAPSTKKTKLGYSIKSVEHACDILEQFSGNTDGMNLIELSNRLGLSKYNTSKLLATLESHDYVEQNENRSGYRLGYKNLQLRHSVVRQMVLHPLSKPILESLTKESGETSDIAILRGAQIIYLDAVEANNPLRVLPRVGIMTPANCTAAGKVLLAGAREVEQHNNPPYTDFRQHAPNTITDIHEFEKHLHVVASRGYAIEDEELDVGLRGVAAPVRNHDGNVVGAVGVSGPIIRFSKDRIFEEFVPLVVKSAKELSVKLGYLTSSP